MMSYVDHSLYLLQICQYIEIIIYVDNLIILASNVDVINELKSIIESKFEMSDLNKLHLFIGVHSERDKRTCTHQRSYIKIILEQFGIADCKPIAIPLDAKTLLAKILEEEYKEHLHEM